MINEILLGIGLLGYNVLITHGLSRLTYKIWNRYIARKTIHLFAAGVTILVMPLLFKEIWIPVSLGFITILMTIIGHIKHNVEWFQIRGNYADVYFTMVYTLLVGLYWNHDFRYAMLPILFMSVGDGVTGIIRNFVYHKQIKGLWGSLGMLISCVVIGYILFGIVGVMAAIIATLLEVQPWLDDNIAVPLGTLLVLFALK